MPSDSTLSDQTQHYTNFRRTCLEKAALPCRLSETAISLWSLSAVGMLPSMSCVMVPDEARSSTVNFHHFALEEVNRRSKGVRR